MDVNIRGTERQTDIAVVGFDNHGVVNPFSRASYGMRSQAQGLDDELQQKVELAGVGRTHKDNNSV